MQRLVDRRLADRGGHVRIASDDRRGAGTDASTRPIKLCKAALLRSIANEVAVLSCRTRDGAEVSDVWEMGAPLAGSARGGRLGKGRSGCGDSHILNRVTAGVAGNSRTLFSVKRSHWGRGWAEAGVIEGSQTEPLRV